MSVNIELLKLILSSVTPIVVLFLGLYINRKLKKIDQKNEKHRQQEIEAKKREIDRQNRIDKKRIEFTIDANVVGMQNGFYIVEFTTTINNKSQAQKQTFTSIILRVRGISKENDIEFWKKKKEEEGTFGENENSKVFLTHRINFAEKIMEENILPPLQTNIFIEPGVKQVISYTTRIAAHISFFIAHVSFYYSDKIPYPHTAEKVFRLQIPEKQG
jgi:hypothetical protein